MALLFLLLMACAVDDRGGTVVPGGDGSTTDGGSTDAGAADGGSGTTAEDGGTDTGDPCVLEEAEQVDWMAEGAFGSGRLLHNGTTTLGGREMPLDVLVTYPATEDGQDVDVAEGGPFPVVLFEHAYGADYLNSDWLLDLLASRGFVTFSVGHNGSWDSAGDWWNDHAELFRITSDLAMAWTEDGASILAGQLDLETTALMGHSHGGGAALHVMRDLDPDAVVLITVRPSLDSSYSSYHSTYDGMPPLLNVAASRDEDSTTAYGTSIAVYEALTRPRFMVTVEGASHYTFTNQASISSSSIPRGAGQTSGGSAIVAFLSYMLMDDERGLHSLRGDVPLFDETEGAVVRTQSHPADALVIDDFEATVSAEGAAIAGIEGQTFVNGFLGDTFVDFDDGVDLLIAQLLALSADGDRVLFYQDASRSTDAYAVALASLDRDLTSLSSDTAFETALADSWDLVVATQQDGNTTDVRPFDDELAAYICDGGKAILADFRTASASAAASFACAGTGFDGTNNWSTMDSKSDLFSGSMSVRNPGWGTYSYGLWTTGTTFATNNVTSTAAPDPSQGPLGAVTATGLETFAELYALDASRSLYMPTQALEVAWSEPSSVRWDFDTPVDASEGRALAVRLLQVHGDVANTGDISLTLQVEDSTGATASTVLTVGGTMEWLSSTVPKSVFQTFRMGLRDLDGVDTSQLAAVSLVFDGSDSGRLIVDDLELSPGLGCE